MGMTRTQQALEELKEIDLNAYEALKYLWKDSFSGEFNHKDVEKFIEDNKIRELISDKNKHLIESIISSIHGVVGIQ